MAVFVTVMLVVGPGVAYLFDSNALATATSPSAARTEPSSAGSVVDATPLARVAPEIQAVSVQAVRLEYRSSDARTGRQTYVSGSAFLPKGAARQRAGGPP